MLLTASTCLYLSLSLHREREVMGLKTGPLGDGWLSCVCECPSGAPSCPPGVVRSQMAVAAVKCVRHSSTRTAMRDSPVTTTRAWSVTMATTWVAPMASAEQRQKVAHVNTMDACIRMGRTFVLDANTSAPALTEQWAVCPFVPAMYLWPHRPVLPTVGQSPRAMLP
ncbi:hypothetical protein WMY93_003545 [Mugilogobius chulae]|uniref:Secreted protein n=1 Tax=Mugilogobius chulae TaxID=88201 RepID=A0AAW0PZV4_9GOBI